MSSNLARYKRHKVCTACKKLLPKTEFYKHPNGDRDGLGPTCKACHKAECLANYHRRVAQV